MTRELDALVAEKVMGHEFCPVHHSLFCCGRGAHYSTSIADAWMVVEKMETDNPWSFILWTRTNIVQVVEHGHDGGYVADVGPCEAMPEAICKAALKAVGHERHICSSCVPGGAETLQKKNICLCEYG